MACTMNFKLSPGRLLAAAIVLLAFWILHGFIEALLVGGVIAIASWPLYLAFRARLQGNVGQRLGAVIFTAAMTLFLLGPMVFACLALLSEAHGLLQALATADSNGLALPFSLADAPVLGPWLDARRQQQLAGPGLLPVLAQHTDAAALLGWAQSLGQFTFRHAMIVGFTVLLLGFLYQSGGAVAQEFTGMLRRAIGDRAERYVEVGTRAVRASVNSMLIVSVFNGLSTALAYAVAGAPRPLLWAAITGALTAVPFLGYAAVAALALQLALHGLSTTALTAALLGCAVLLIGDKLVRPMVARDGMRLPFVWVLMGCIGGFGMLGLAGVVIGPVLLTLARELWEQRARESVG